MMINEKIAQIRAEFCGGNNKEFARILGKSTQYASNICKPGKSVGEDAKEHILSKFPQVSRSWLLANEGPMLKEEKSQASGTNIPHAELFMVPLISKYAYAGYLAGYGDNEYVETLPLVPFIIPEGQTHHGEYVAFEVKGDSMENGTIESLLDGDIVLCRKVKRELWTGGCKLHCKKYNFVIAHTEGLLVKRIIDHNVEAGTITVHSLNPEYPDRVLNLNDVIEIRNVVQLQRKPIL